MPRGREESSDVGESDDRSEGNSSYWIIWEGSLSASRGVWSSDESSEPIPTLDARQLMLLFRYHVLRNLLASGRIGQTTLDILDRFHHSGFSACEGQGDLLGNAGTPPGGIAQLHLDDGFNEFFVGSIGSGPAPARLFREINPRLVKHYGCGNRRLRNKLVKKMAAMSSGSLARGKRPCFPSAC